VSIFFSFIGVFGSALLWLLSFKVVAVWLGPAGLGLYSQLRQIVQAATIGATFGGTNAVVQGLSEREQEMDRRRFRATASRLICILCAAVTLVFLIFAPVLTRVFLSSDEPGLIASVRWLSVAVLMSVGATYGIAVLNGYRAYRILALTQIAGPLGLVVALAAAYFLKFEYHPEMLAWLFVLCFGISFLVGAWGVVRLPREVLAISYETMPFREIWEFVKFAVSILCAAFSTSAAMLLIRSWIIESRGLAFTGLFEAGWTLTFNYTTLFLTACSIIYLPMLTRSTEPNSQRVCMLRTAYLVLSAGTLICYLMVMFKTPLIRLLYSSQFDDAGNLLVILAVAAILRGVSWVYGMLIVATRKSQTLLLSEVLRNIVLLAFVWHCLRTYSTLEALGWAFVAANFLYLIFAVEYVRWENGLLKRRNIWPLVVLAGLPLLMNWSDAQWVQLAIGITVSGIACYAYRKVPG
jgi:PST family polysaccharide transporter